MSDALKKINPLEYISPHDPLPEAVKDVSKWFKTETVELTFGKEIGKPSELITADRDMLAWYFSQGWYVDAILSSASGGSWQSVSTAQATQMANAVSTSSASNVSTAQSQSSASNSSTASASGTGNTKASDTWEHWGSGVENPTVVVLGTTTNSSSSGSNSGSASSSGASTNSGTATSNGTSENSGTSSSTTTQDGGAYWYSCQRIRLKRRKMQSEAVLQDMITSFTKAYNEGREINNARYDELVSLYALMLSRTEDEANGFGFSADDFKPLVQMVIGAVRDALEKYGKSVGDIPDDWLKQRVKDINDKFDALVGEAKTVMVGNGTYNSTVWPTTLAGIERRRADALNALKDDMVTLKVETYGKIATLTADVGNKLMDCATRIIEAQQKLLLGPTEVRNTVFKWMLDFMERRDDEYPGLEQLVTVADRLGYGDGAAAGAGTV